MKVFFISVAVAIGGYIIGLATGIALVHLFSSPKPDKSMEAVMTGFFYVGPLFAVAGFVVALIYQVVRRGT
jgi:hypothetical protein